MSEEVANLLIRVSGKDFGEFDIPYSPQFETDDREDWYREVYEGSLEPVGKRLNALGFYDPDNDKDRAAIVDILDEEGNTYWSYELHQAGTYGSLSHVTIPQEVAYDPTIPPKRLRDV